MGIFSFLKDIGKKPEEGKELRETLSQAVQKAGLKIKNFTVKVDDGQANLSGMAETTKDLELARLIVGNFKGIEKVNDDNLKLAPTAQAQPQAQPQAAQQPPSSKPATASSPSARMVTVKSGDTLSKLAKEYLGNANLYTEIFEANRPMIKDPDEIFPGQVIRIPAPSASSAP